MGWADAVKKAQLQPGQWKCPACFVKNEDAATVCISCEADRPGHEGAAAAAKKAGGQISSAGFKFGGTSASGGGGGFKFGAASAAPASSAGGGGGFKFGGASASGGGGGSAGGFKFGGASAPAADKPAPPPPKKPTAPAAKSWADMLAQKKAAAESTWKCHACFVPNQIGVLICVSCDTPKLGCEVEAKAQAAAAASATLAAAGISFGRPAAVTTQADSAAAPAGKKAKLNAPAEHGVGNDRKTDGSATVSFGDGKLGLNFVRSSCPLVVKGLSDQAAEMEGLVIGMELRAVGGTDVSGMAYDAAVELIKAASRPVTMTFCQPGGNFAGGSGGAVSGGTMAVSTVDEQVIERPSREKNVYRLGVTTGRVLICGSGECGQLGVGMKISEVANATHLSVFDRKSMVSIAAGGMHTLALDSNGGVWSWGCNDDFTLGRRSRQDEGVPRKLTDLPTDDPVVQLAAGSCHSAILTRSGSVYTWGTYKDSNGHIGFKPDCDDFKQELPELMAQLERKGVVQLACGSHHTCALTRDGQLYCWGDAEHGQIGREVSRETKQEKRKGLLPGPPVSFTGSSGGSKKRKAADTDKLISAVACGSYHTLCLDDQGRVITFGLNNYGQCGTGDMVSPVVVPNVVQCERMGGTANVTQLAGGEHHSLALHQDGSVSAWGRGDYSQLGLGKPPKDKALSQRSLPKKCYPFAVRGQPPAVAISCGDSHSLLVTDDGALFTWGFGDMGALCSGENDDIHVPTEVDPNEFPRGAEGAQVMAASAGGLHTVMLVTN